jgi:hypothetical protein
LNHFTKPLGNPETGSNETEIAPAVVPQQVVHSDLLGTPSFSNLGFIQPQIE